jgi:hypothetical protein
MRTPLMTALSPRSSYLRTIMIYPGPLPRRGSHGTLVDPAYPDGGATAFGYGREEALDGPDDFLESPSLFLGPDRASERGDAR